MSLFQNIANGLESLMIPCYFKMMFGIDCPGCGLQRSIILLLKGDVADAVFMYPPLLPIVGILILYVANMQLNYTGKKVLFSGFVWLLAALVLVNFLYKWVLVFIELI